MTTPVEIARAAWGEHMPDWVEGLARECAASNQTRVATRMGRSPSLISQLLRNKYPGDLDGLKETFNAVFRNSKVDCPALGEISTVLCRDWRDKARAYQNTSFTRVRMFRACHACPLFKGSKK